MRLARVGAPGSLCRLAVGAALLAACGVALPACGKDESKKAPACIDDASGTRAISLGSACVKLSSVRVLRKGAWQPIATSDATITPGSDGTARLDLSAAAPAEAFEWTLTGLQGDSMLQQGYQSWSFAGAVKIPASVARAADGSLDAPVPLDGDPLKETAGISYGSTVVGTAGGSAVAAGVLHAEVATTALGVEQSDGTAKLTILYGTTRETLPADAMGIVHAEPILLASADHAGDALSTLALAMKTERPASPKRPPGGWFSWNQLFDQVTEADVRANMAVAAQRLLPAGMPLVEIDDGWEVAWGDWKANTKFPSGMEKLGGDIVAKGLAPGVWMAPFLVDVASAPAKSSPPELFVRGADGKPLVHRPSGLMRDFYVLDGTNPDAMALAAAPIASMRKAGYGFFKLDFLYAGALPGVRKDARATGNQALRAGLLELRKAMGDAVLNACGAPIDAVLGIADSLRVGTDTAYAAVALNWADVVFAARSTAARAYLSPLVYPDGDQTQVRAPYTSDEAAASAYVAALSGAAYSVGDDLTKLPEDRFALLLDPRILDLAGAATSAIPDDVLAGAPDKIILAPLFDSILHAKSTGAPPPQSFRMPGKTGKSYTLDFTWTDTHTVVVHSLNSRATGR